MIKGMEMIGFGIIDAAARRATFQQVVHAKIIIIIIFSLT
jgi:hypothetical protein